MKQMKRAKQIIICLLFAVVLAGAMPKSSVEATSIKLSPKKITLTVGKSKKLTVKGTKKKVTWSSNRKKVATVTKRGKVTAKRKGTATITAKVGGKKLKCKVTVKAKQDVIHPNVPSEPTVPEPSKIEVTSIYLNKNSQNLLKGETVQLIATISPFNATDKKIIWDSSNKEVATVDNGMVIAIGAGETDITAKSSNGLSKICTIKVFAPTCELKNTLPEIFYSSSRVNIYSKVNITECQTSFQTHSVDDKVELNIGLTAQKIYDIDGDYGQWSCHVIYKIYNSDDILVYSGDMLNLNVNVGDKFIMKAENIYLPDDDYYLELNSYILR